MLLTADAKERLDLFLSRSLPEHSRSKLVKMIGEGLVTVQGRHEKSSFKLEPGMEVELPEPEESAVHDLTPADIPLDVVYEDEYMLVVNKPRGLATHPAISLKEPSMVNALLARNHTLSEGSASYRPGIVHRLDKDTTGLIVVAKTDAAHVSLAAQIEGKVAERRYLSVVHGEPERERFVIDAPIARDKTNRQKMAADNRGKRAVTHIRKIMRLDTGTLLAVRLETGRTHQIRVHLRAIGHPVLGDRLYAPKEMAGGVLQLHAAYLGLEHPINGEPIRLYVAPPEDFMGHDVPGLQEAVEEM